MDIQVAVPGPLTTVQDEGRFGYQQYGIGPAGVMDVRSYRAANRLVGNEKGEAVLEATMMGPTLLFGRETLVALTGADMKPAINREPVPMYTALRVRPGDELRTGFAVNGCRTYLAFSGGIDVPVVMGSRSTFLKSRLGGKEGRALAAGDELPLGACDTGGFAALEGKSLPRPVFGKQVTLRFVPGPQADYFTERGMRDFTSSVYTVTNESDRMGYRLDGVSVESVHGVDIVSDGIVFGSIQIPANGKPIVLMADRQTTGGYAKIGTVITADLPLLAQAGPGTGVRFVPVSVEEAQQVPFEV